MKNLLQNNEPRVPKLSRKWKWAIFGGLAVLLTVLNIVQQKTGAGQTQRQLAYAEGLRVPAQHADSVLLRSLYEKLNAVYDHINTLDFDSLEKFNAVNVKTLPADFHSKMITYELLEAVFDTLMQHDVKEANSYDVFFGDINSTMGNGNFRYEFSTREFQKGFASDARYLFSDKYFMVLMTFDLVLPDANTDDDTFTSGRYYGGVLVFDIHTTELVGYETFATTNSDEVQSGPMVKERVDETLLQDLEKNVRARVNDVSQSFFSTPIWPTNHN